MSDAMNETVRLTTMRELERGKVVTQNRFAWRRTQLSVPAGAKWRGHPTFRPPAGGVLGRGPVGPAVPKASWTPNPRDRHGHHDADVRPLGVLRRDGGAHGVAAMRGWVGVGLDGTLAEYHGWQGPEHIGAPIPAMVERVKAWLAEGRDVRIFTARAWPIGTLAAFDVEQEGTMRREQAAAAIAAVRRWCEQHLGQVLPVTCVKDFGMVESWDDRAVQVRPNTGERADGA